MYLKKISGDFTKKCFDFMKAIYIWTERKKGEHK